MLTFLCILLALWVLSTQCVLVSKTSFNSWWYILLCTSAIMFYFADHLFWMCFSWSLMGFSSQAIVGSSPTIPTSKAVSSMIAFSTLSTFFCFSALLSTYTDLDQGWKLSLHFPSKTLTMTNSFLSFLALSVKSLLFPFSSWLLSAMKGVAVMSSLVHSLTIVFSGLFLTTFLLIEGWYWLDMVEFTGILFLPSSLYHLFFLFCESHGKSMLAWSTGYSVNLCHVILPWNPSFALLYGILHGLSKSFLFASSQGFKSLSWSLLSGLLGGFPLSLLWKVKTSFTYDSSLTSTFLLWGLLSYWCVFVKLCFKMLLSVYKAMYWESFAHSWFTLAILLGLVFL